AVLDALRIEHAAQDVVTDAGKVLHAAPADQNNRVLLQVVTFAGDVANGFVAVLGQTDLGDLTQSRVRLLRGRRINAGANAATLGRTFQSRDLVTGGLGLARLADQLVDRRHTICLFSIWRR